MNWADEMSDEELPPEQIRPKPEPKPEPKPAPAKPAAGPTSLFPRATGGSGFAGGGYQGGKGGGGGGGKGGKGKGGKRKDKGKGGGGGYQDRGGGGGGGGGYQDRGGYRDRDRDRDRGGGGGGGGNGSRGPGDCMSPRCTFKIHSCPPAHFTEQDRSYCCSLCRMSSAKQHGGKCEKIEWTPPSEAAAAAPTPVDEAQKALEAVAIDKQQGAQQGQASAEPHSPASAAPADGEVDARPAWMKRMGYQAEASSADPAATAAAEALPGVAICGTFGTGGRQVGVVEVGRFW